MLLDVLVLINLWDVRRRPALERLLHRAAIVPELKGNMPVSTLIGMLQPDQYIANRQKARRR